MLPILATNWVILGNNAFLFPMLPKTKEIVANLGNK